MAIGPDHKYPLGGPINPDDQGGLSVGFHVVKDQRMAIMQFGTMVTWLAGRPDEMRVLARTMREAIIKNFGNLPYDKATLPIRVVANKQQQVIEFYLPQPVEILGANPEMWLALAEVIETATKQFAPKQ